MIFSREIKFSDKIQTIFVAPELYEAEGLDDLINNSRKTKCPFYKSSRSSNKEKVLKDKPYFFYFSEGAIIRTNFLLGQLKKEENREYSYKLNVRDNERNLDINVFDWPGLYVAKQNILNEGTFAFVKENYPIQFSMMQEAQLFVKQTQKTDEVNEISFSIVLTPEQRKKLDGVQEELFYEAEELQKKELNGLMPPCMNPNLDTLKEDFKEANFIGSLFTFYSHKDGKLYLFDYTKNVPRKKLKQEKYNYNFKQAYNPI